MKAVRQLKGLQCQTWYYFTFPTLEGVLMILKSFSTVCIPSGYLFMQDVFTVSWVNVISLYKYFQESNPCITLCESMRVISLFEREGNTGIV